MSIQAVNAHDPFEITPEVRARWEAYAVAKIRAEASLVLSDGLAAAQASYALVEEVAAQGAMGPNIVPLRLRAATRR